MKGRVIKSTGSWYTVKSDDNCEYNCRIKGKLRLNDSKLTNPIAVGDIVTFEKENSNEKTGIIKNVEPRVNYLIRRSNKLSSKYHIIASNIDCILLIVTIAKPRTTTVFIDRILLCAEAYRIPAIIVINKKDIYNIEQLNKLDELKHIYNNIGYKVLVISALNDNDIEELKKELSKKISLITGHSGVGKSTIINKLNPQLSLKTSSLSKYHQRGMHSTTFAQMHEITPNSHIIDTPGIKDFGIIDFENENISLYFKDISKYAALCKFNNCTHVFEPHCKVIEALKKNKIPVSRYESYINIVNSIKAE
ncbi:MAG: ribosome small subunit-dependent GTPase A [Bacteroidetes bacterium]|nr:ribosome small subunit-dependent GTPase A [Bacteroidota bacterium]